MILTPGKLLLFRQVYGKAFAPPVAIRQGRGVSAGAAVDLRVLEIMAELGMVAELALLLCWAAVNAIQRFRALDDA